MDRTSAPNSVAGLYVDDDPPNAIQGTLLIAEDRNAIQEEIVNAIEAAGLTPAAANLEQLKAAIEILAWAKVLASDGTGSTLDADTVDAIQAARMIYGDDATGATSVTDANSATKSGFYELATPFTNGPTGAAYIILTMRIVSSVRIFQIAVATGGNATYVRNYNGSWTAWAKLWNADNDGSGSGLDADTVDGIDSTRILYGDGQRATTAIADANAPVKTGIYQLLTPFTNGPTASAYYIIHVESGDGNHGYQIAEHYSSDNMYIRRRNTGVWSDWKKLWNAGNDGSGSGLDADTVDGVHASQIVSGIAGRATTATSNINNLVKSGFYYSSDTTNNPTAANYFVTHHVADSVDNMAYQIAILPNAAINMYARYNSSGTWQAWKRIWTVDSDGSGSGLDADTVRGTTPGTRGLTALSQATTLDADTVDGCSAAEGEYTPTITYSSTETISTLTAKKFKYMQIGSTVHVSGTIRLETVSGSGNNLYSLYIPLPVDASWGSATDESYKAAGVVSADIAATYAPCGIVEGQYNSGTERAVAKYRDNHSGSFTVVEVRVEFTYRLS